MKSLLHSANHKFSTLTLNGLKAIAANQGKNVEQLLVIVIPTSIGKNYALWTLIVSSQFSYSSIEEFVHVHPSNKADFLVQGLTWKNDNARPTFLPFFVIKMHAYTDTKKYPTGTSRFELWQLVYFDPLKIYLFWKVSVVVIDVLMKLGVALSQYVKSPFEWKGINFRKISLTPARSIFFQFLFKIRITTIQTFQMRYIMFLYLPQGGHQEYFKMCQSIFCRSDTFSS